MRKIYAFLIDSVQTFLIAAAVFLVIYLFLFRPYEVKGDSMFPNFHDKEFVLTNLVVLRFQDPKMGNIVVFKAKAASEPERDYIKRVIGMPGDTIAIKDSVVYLNQNILDESSYLKNDVKTFPGSFLQEGEEVKIPQGEYFVMGDNRLYSSDSREWGFVKKEDIVGESLFVYWPLNRMRLIDNPY
ncbi:signal peptidase I [Candidatus Woesebacteria bacterium RBG_13_34_9]|uniref:Signal peptidase I n=1 Tax=Candidatus Woesebacteria bacterium RBG_13_34_9 TaxID=1802477 RepID=A0A1F7WZU5_9BACT|nr:MAG: signal peptidase I [Candidatus Woesebacteria bacterium RBG_13_34_9]